MHRHDVFPGIIRLHKHVTKQPNKTVLQCNLVILIRNERDWSTWTKMNHRIPQNLQRRRWEGSHLTVFLLRMNANCYWNIIVVCYCSLS